LNIVKSLKQGVLPARGNPLNSDNPPLLPSYIINRTTQPATPIQQTENVVGKTVPKKKVDPHNPYNDKGKIVRGHPKYFEVLEKAQKLMEGCLNELRSKNYVTSKQNLQSAYDLLEQLEE